MPKMAIGHLTFQIVSPLKLSQILAIFEQRYKKKVVQCPFPEKIRAIQSQFIKGVRSSLLRPFHFVEKNACDSRLLAPQLCFYGG